MTLEFSLKALKMLEHDEGRKSFPYVDTTGNITIGIGHNLSANGVSDYVLERMFAEDLIVATQVCERIFGADFIAGISELRQLALINLAYNLGETGFRKFAPTIALMKQNRWDEAAKRILKSKYASQVKSRAERVATMLRGEGFPYDAL